jgi:hypothetical protein
LLGDPRNPHSLSTYLRRRRDVALRALIRSISAEKGAIRILDMGGTFEYWERVGIAFLREMRANIILVNLTYSQPPLTEDCQDIIHAVVGDACNLEEYEDNSFDLVHSNSVIEHVETWANMKLFASETRRLAKNYYVQTPYFWFPIDPHFYKFPLFHMFPRPFRARLLNLLPIATSGRIDGVDMAFQVVDKARLLDGRQFRFLFPDASIRYELFLGLPKSMIAIRRS